MTNTNNTLLECRHIVKSYSGVTVLKDVDFEMKRGGRRWNYYRLASHSHNVPLLDDRDQDPMAAAKFVSFAADPAQVVIDLGTAYPAATTARRGVAMRGRSLLVQDEFELAEAHAVTFGLTTRAAIAIGDDGEVRLRHEGKELLVRALAPAGSLWTQASAEQAPPQRENKGVRRLELRVPTQSGTVRLAVQFAPCWPAGTPPPLELRPLADW